MQALFKARFEQALESQKLNIKKTEQELRRKGVNPDDPVAMASIQRVASTFFNAIDKREGSPYVFREDKHKQLESDGFQPPEDAGDDSDQEELDRFIADIEDAADKEWEEEEAAEKEELHRIRYWNREDFGGRFGRSEGNGGDYSDDENRGRMKNWNQTHRRATVNSRDEDGDVSELNDELDSDGIGEVNHGSDGDVSEEALDEFAAKVERRQQSKPVRANSRGFRNEMESWGRNKKSTVPQNALSELDDVVSESEGKGRSLRDSRTSINNYRSSSDDESYEQLHRYEGSNSKRGTKVLSESETARWESDATSGDEFDHHSSDDESSR